MSLAFLVWYDERLHCLRCERAEPPTPSSAGEAQASSPMEIQAWQVWVPMDEPNEQQTLLSCLREIQSRLAELEAAFRAPSKPGEDSLQLAGGQLTLRCPSCGASLRGALIASPQTEPTGAFSRSTPSTPPESEAT